MRVSACSSSASSSSTPLDGRRRSRPRLVSCGQPQPGRVAQRLADRQRRGGRSRPGAGSRCRSGGAPTGSPLTVIGAGRGSVTPGQRLDAACDLPEPLSPMIATSSPGSMLSVVGGEDLLVLDRASRRPRRRGAARRARRARRSSSPSKTQAVRADRRSRTPALSRAAPRRARRRPACRCATRGRAARRGRRRAHDLGVEARDVRVVEHDVVGTRRGRCVRRAAVELRSRCVSQRRRPAARERVSCPARKRSASPPIDDRVAVREPARLAAEALAVELRAVARAEVGDQKPPCTAGSRRDGATRLRWGS